MKVRVVARHNITEIASSLGTSEPAENGFHYVEMPDDVESFLRVVSEYGRFNAIPPGEQEEGLRGAPPIDSEHWTLDFQNDYD
jgi:hypothetical protein